MDIVLVDFIKAAFAIHNIPPEPWTNWNFHHKWFTENDAKFWEPMGEKFWAEMPWTKEGKATLENVTKLVGIENIALLTTPCATHGCLEGKKAWVKREIPQLSKRLFLGSSKYFMASPNHVLIDDSDHNCESFREYGGKAILVPRPFNKNAHLTCENGYHTDEYIIDELTKLIEG